MSPENCRFLAALGMTSLSKISPCLVPPCWIQLEGASTLNVLLVVSLSGTLPSFTTIS